ncbi:lytic transglycosylase domain-containing protein [Magnetospirillum sp. UT-4]|uniref:lytic transglycosylase domain-containing protein n=1 Tax=Magnetospirillum sp. UT-4 TaxID=2681467 RepID=UPI0020C2DC71|nr:lytic transglycosylase domain-containing protein [Magnetospirillum sp. UT-4]
MAATSPALAADSGPSKGAIGTQVAAASGGGGTMTAAVMPGIGREARVAPLPRPLSAADADTYARVFKLQAEGQWAAADRELGRVKSDVLMGHALAQRFLASGYKPKYQELRAWMAEYSDHPQAEAIYRLATTKGVKGFGSIKAPVKGALKGSGIDTTDDGANWEEEAFFPDRGSAKAQALKSRFRSLLRQDKAAQALAILTGPEARSLDRLDVDEMKAALASDHFAGGRDAEAVAWALQAAERSGDELPAAHWIAGLAQWRQGKPELARTHFEAVANTDEASPWMVSAGAFWAARANLVSRRPELVNHWLEIAATFPRTFYGLLARQTLGYETLFSWEIPPFTDADAEVLSRVPGAKRALALLQLGRRDAAEDELRKAYPRATKAVRQSMLTLAQLGDMPGLAVRLGGMAPGRMGDAAAFPVPEWNPKGGWQMDKALVFAFVRQESSFNPAARSRAGAAGLMQIMPATAAAIAGKQARDRLGDPEYNLALGQRYLSRLLSEAPVNGNLLMLAAAYNAGPGKLGQWLAGMRHGNDPLMFIESLPSRETRGFVERVMTNYWIYRARLGQTSPSLDAVAAGAWPRYEAQDASSSSRKGSRS